MWRGRAASIMLTTGTQTLLRTGHRHKDKHRDRRVDTKVPSE